MRALRSGARCCDDISVTATLRLADDAAAWPVAPVNTAAEQNIAAVNVNPVRIRAIPLGSVQAS